MDEPSDLDNDPEFLAIRVVYSALKGLDPVTQRNVLNYVSRRLDLKLTGAENDPSLSRSATNNEPAAEKGDEKADPPTTLDVHDELEGVSPVAQKWIKRNGLTGEQLSKLYSLGMEDIELIAQSVPGKSKAEKVRSVTFLLGISAYLGSGAARIPDDKLRETCGHYDAYDAPNFAKHLKALASEISGSKEAGYTLTPRGLSAATELLKKVAST